MPSTHLLCDVQFVACVIVQRLQLLALVLQGGLLLQQGQAILGGLGAGRGDLVEFSRQPLHLHVQILQGLTLAGR